ncbi:hypothetical protein KM043_018321 [Ampulex compressa]|nr:hypothetical protein KM043_018321 [Ampulex compressa]
MAAAELKHDNVLCDETTKSNASTTVTHREIECYRFNALDLLFYILSAGIFLMDVATDSIVFMEYLLQGHLAWGYFAMSFTILPTCIVHLFSLRWYYSDGSLRRIDWLLHFLFLGILHRYMYLLYIALQSLISKKFTKDKNQVYRQQSDICMLHLFESFMGAAPQLILQLYVMAVLHQASLWTSLSAIVSCCSLTWAVGTYTKAMHKVNSDYKASWIALTLQALWRGGMLTSRIAVLVLTAVCIRKWFLLFFGIHWLFMTVWIILQNTDFCPTIWEERIYNCIIGLIYCFDFFNLHVDTTKTDIVIVIVTVIIGGMIIGLTSMLFYYGKFHPSKIIGISKNEIKSENNVNKVETPRSFKQYYRGSLAALPHSIDISQRTVSQEVTTDKQFLLTNIIQVPDCIEEGVVNQMCSVENESATAVHIISECEPQHNDMLKEENNLTEQNSLNTSSNNPLVNSAIIHNISGQNTTNSNNMYFDITADYNENSDMETIHRQKRRGICLPVVQDLDIDKDVEDSTACLPSQKRRGICSSTQFIFEIENDLNEKIASNDSEWQTVIADSLDSDTKFDNKSDTLESSLSKVYNNLNSIKNREKLRTPIIFDSGKLSGVERLSKDFQQRDETMSCVTSIHDYENVCPLGVARPPWCIRSWKGYTDIETYIHDDSIVRDRRRDTLTSTTTGTTYSSDFSDTTCASSLIKGILKQEDYLDTLVYDLIDPYDLKSAYTDEFSMKMPMNIEEQNTTLYIAKPVVIDDKGGMFALDTILEEHDDVPADNNFKYGESACNSVSTLVSTIDQIRKYTAENSPRHVYHTTETQWEDLDPKTVVKHAQLTKALFKSDLQGGSMLNNPENSGYRNSMDDTGTIVKGEYEVDAIRELMKCCRIQSIKKTPLIDAILSDSPILGSRTKLQKHVTIAYCKNEADNSENDLYVEMSPLVPVKDIDSISINLSGTEMCSNVNASSAASKCTPITPDVMPRLSNLYPFNIHKPGVPCEKRKKAVSYSKRKFSLLKERFEPKPQLVYVVTPNNAILSQSAFSPNSDIIEKKVSVFVKKKPDTSVTYDKENLVPDVSSKIAQSHNIVSEKNMNAEMIDQNNKNHKSLRNVDINLSERRHIFLEQVLSPPKLLNWNKKKLSNSSTKKL